MEKDVNALEVLVRESISEEQKAAATYMERAAKLEEMGFKDEAAVFRDVASEELVHASEFQTVLDFNNIDNTKEETQGAEEASEILAGKNDEETDNEESEPESTEESPKEELEESANVSVDEKYVSKSDLYGRLINLLDLIPSEDQSTIDIISDATNYFDVDTLEGFFKHILTERDIDVELLTEMKSEENAVDVKAAVMQKLAQNDQHFNGFWKSLDLEEFNQDAEEMYTEMIVYPVARQLAKEDQTYDLDAELFMIENMMDLLREYQASTNEDGSIASLGAAPSVSIGVVEPSPDGSVDLKMIEKLLNQQEQ